MNNFKSLEDILNNINGNIMIIVEYGSYVYETVTEKSDKDLICIIDSDNDIYDVQVHSNLNIDLHLISFKTFQKLLNEHDIMALETYYQLPTSFKALLEFNLDLDILRRKVSTVVSNSWSKARKKLDIPEEDDYLGLKSLFHSLRILSYGINIAENNKIDYLNVTLDGEIIACKKLFESILNDYKNGYRWNEFKEKYKAIHNANATKFRELAPKKLD